MLQTLSIVSPAQVNRRTNLDRLGFSEPVHSSYYALNHPDRTSCRPILSVCEQSLTNLLWSHDCLDEGRYPAFSKSWAMFDLALSGHPLAILRRFVPPTTNDICSYTFSSRRCLLGNDPYLGNSEPCFTMNPLGTRLPALWFLVSARL